MNEQLHVGGGLYIESTGKYLLPFVHWERERDCPDTKLIWHV